MLLLSNQDLSQYVSFVFLYAYVFSGYFLEWLLFYPVGIILALYVLAAIYYMVLSTAQVFKFYINWLYYNLLDVLAILDLLTTYSKYVVQTYIHLHPLLTDVIKSYSIYRFVFLLKRVEFYIFWILVILGYC